jgi:hypothetical protein
MAYPQAPQTVPATGIRPGLLFVLALLAWPLGIVGGGCTPLLAAPITMLVMSANKRRQILAQERQFNVRVDGKGFATAALFISISSLAIGLIVLLVFVAWLASRDA